MGSREQLMARPKTTTKTGARAPTRELGAILGGSLTPAGMAPWSSFYDDQEFVPELQWPTSVATYKQMRSDAQLSALYNATAQSLLRFKWSIDPNGADDDMVNKISEDYNLPILGAEVNTRRRSKRRFSFRKHLWRALNAGIYGHYYFEQVGYIGQGNNPPDDGLWHLRKLAERPPWTIQEIRVASDGGLVSIVQNVQKSGGPMVWGSLPEIPVDTLVGYVWDQEGANWAGRSWFRECYKNWVIKDRLMRIDAINHERAGGVPYIEAHPGATYEEIERLNQMAQGFRIGDTAGGAVPAGAKFNIARGTNSSVVDSIQYHDEAMARRFMLMVMQLGQTQTGSRALGSTFIDFWAHGLETIADWVCDTFNEHVIEDDVDWNWGEEVEQVPILTYEFDPQFIITDLAEAVREGIIVMDEELEHYARKEMGLPEIAGPPRLTPEQQLAQDAAEQAAKAQEQSHQVAMEVAKNPPPAKPAGNQQPAKAAAGAGALPPVTLPPLINDEEE
jgi:hypothetical protein